MKTIFRTLGIIALTLIIVFAFTACPDSPSSGGGGGGGGGKKTGGGETYPAGTLNITLPGKFSGTATLHFPAGMPTATRTAIQTKFNEAWNASPLIDAVDSNLDDINEVLGRGLRINVETGGTPYDYEKVVDWRTISFHANYLSTALAGDLSTDLISTILGDLHGMSEVAMILHFVRLV